MLKILSVYAFAVAYAVVRYVAFNPDNSQNLPVFVFNKGISMAAAFCFAIAFFCQWRAQRIDRNEVANDWFRAGIFGAIAHVPLSLAILRPGYFREFFADDRLSFGGEVVVLFGAATLGGIYLLSRAHWSVMHRWGISLATLTVLFTHTLSMGLVRGLRRFVPVSRGHQLR